MITGQAPEEGATHKAKSMEVVPSGELQKQFGRYSDEAMIRPVGVSRNGRVRFVMVPVDEYERLRRRERVAGRVTASSRRWSLRTHRSAPTSSTASWGSLRYR
jgi:PHD/YefM family antitoxin component YafN of YafNO toxin-antitoxin module